MILLDKDYALEKAENQYYLGHIDEYKKNAIIKFLNSLPSAQSEIIRCKDCMHNGSFDTDCPIKWDGKEYCSFAERRTDVSK